MKFVLLSQAFYDKYIECKEILRKKDRPYCVILLQINNVNVAIPFRSHIKHKYAFFTNKKVLAGLDYTKSVVVDLDIDIDLSRKAFIRPEEYKNLLGKDYEIRKGFLRFVKRYRKALYKQELPENKYLVQASTLQYFKEVVDKFVNEGDSL